MTTRVLHRLAARILLVTFTTCSVGAGSSFGQAPPPPAGMIAPDATLPTPPTLPARPPDPLTKDELRDLVAPIALYPDVVLASLLPATTNPDQLHEAAQFVGTAARVERIPEDRGWDGSIVGLLQFPDVLRWLDENPAWTDQMGQAVTYQQGDVLQAIQDFRRAAKDAGNLNTNEYQRVRAEPDRDIRIEPARPDVVYVPSYDPALATQPQPVVASPGINPWLAFGGGVAVGALGAWALYSIFDDDDHGHYDNHYYGGSRRIRGYDNYYYYGRRRPRSYDWNPRPRPYGSRPQGWQRPRRLEHAAPSTRPVHGGALRPPRQRPGAEPLRPREQRQETRRQRQLRRQENRQGRQQQRRGQRQQRQELRRENKRQKQQDRQQKRQSQQQQRREQKGQRQERRQEQRTQRQENRQAAQAQRQERRTEQKAQGQQKKQNAQKNKKKQQQQ